MVISTSALHKQRAAAWDGTCLAAPCDPPESVLAATFPHTAQPCDSLRGKGHGQEPYMAENPAANGTEGDTGPALNALANHGDM